MFVVVREKLKLALHIVSGAILLQSLVLRSKDAMFANSNFDIVQSPGFGLHHPTYFGRVGWQSSNVPMERMD